ncbi:SCO family protein [Ramlibacter humi]|uniref:SCO family protein n=1 Tax=Ramlibacter humi TaxID=2530451 RepID=A0A4Z0BFG7_9BURK|nr:SCO family protein [Ramlibacter humi]TFY97203.1 SCO family protein [Ramlibacter humi]
MKRLLLLLLLACGAAAAQPLALPAPPEAGLEQHIGARVPLDLAVTDEAGRARTLADVIDGTRPVLLVPGYYRCPQLCGLVMRSLLEALNGSGTDRARWRIVGVSVDPQETAADARMRHALDAEYADSLAPWAGPLDLQLLTLTAPQLQRIATAIGVRFERLPPGGGDQASFAHPATVVVLTPRGEISRYFNGMGMAPGELRVALADAAGDRLGSATGRLALLCVHFDPHVGRLNQPVMNAARAGSVLLVIALAGWCWRRRGGRPGDGR